MKPVFRTIIVDDENQAISNLEKLLAGYPEIRVIDTFTDPVLAVDRIVRSQPDLLLTDIEMPGMNGFEMAEAIYSKGVKPDLVFVTAYDQFAIEAVRHAAFDYLVKPIDPAELKNAIGRLVLASKEINNDDRLNLLIERTSARQKIKLNTAGGFILVRPEDIVYIQADWNYTEIYFSDVKKEVVTTNIGNVAGLFPEIDFFRLSRSLIINLMYLSRVNRKKRQAILVKDSKEYSFKIPLLNIRKLERFLG
jgi:two-component system, LytTR family, response regulator